MFKRWATSVTKTSSATSWLKSTTSQRNTEFRTKRLWARQVWTCANVGLTSKCLTKKSEQWRALTRIERGQSVTGVCRFKVRIQTATARRSRGDMKTNILRGVAVSTRKHCPTGSHKDCSVSSETRDPLNFQAKFILRTSTPAETTVFSSDLSNASLTRKFFKTCTLKNSSLL